MGGASRLEALHFALSASHRLMEVFGWIVLSEPLAHALPRKDRHILRERSAFRIPLPPPKESVFCGINFAMVTPTGCR
jgi:hypothetical protein